MIDYHPDRYCPFCISALMHDNRGPNLIASFADGRKEYFARSYMKSFSESLMEWLNQMYEAEAFTSFSLGDMYAVLIPIAMWNGNKICATHVYGMIKP
jgi:hypothetical protein